VRAEARRADLSAWIHSHRKRLAAVAVAGLVTATGIFFAGHGLLAGDPVRVDMAAIEQGLDLGGREVEITGRLVGENAISFNKRVRESTLRAGNAPPPTLYIPLVSHDWSPGQPIRVYLQIWEPNFQREAGAFATGRYRGMLSANSMPGEVVTIMADRGQPLADRHWVLASGWTAAMERNFGYGLFCIGVVIGLLAAVWWAIGAALTRAQRASEAEQLGKAAGDGIVRVGRDIVAR
jgi:hypothetical protein